MGMTLKELLLELADDNFYGELLLKYENGKITLVRKIQNIKLK